MLWLVILVVIVFLSFLLSWFRQVIPFSSESEREGSSQSLQAGIFFFFLYRSAAVNIYIYHIFG